MNKWDLTYLFKTKEDFLEELNNLPPYGDKLSSYQGKLGEEKEFVEYVLLKDEFDKRATRVYEYAALQSDLNKKVVEKANDCHLDKKCTNKTVTLEYLIQNNYLTTITDPTTKEVINPSSYVNLDTNEFIILN